MAAGSSGLGKLPSGSRNCEPVASAPSGSRTLDVKNPPAPLPASTRMCMPAGDCGEEGRSHCACADEKRSGGTWREGGGGGGGQGVGRIKRECCSNALAWPRGPKCRRQRCAEHGLTCCFFLTLSLSLPPPPLLPLHLAPARAAASPSRTCQWVLVRLGVLARGGKARLSGGTRQIC